MKRRKQEEKEIEENEDDDVGSDDNCWLSKGEDVGLSRLTQLMLSISSEMLQSQRNMNRDIQDGMKNVRKDVKSQLT